MNTIFIVDDDEDVLHSLRALLEASGFNVKVYHSAKAVLESYSSLWHGCLITDVRMPGMNGLELQAEMKRLNMNLPVIMMTGNGDIPLAVEAMKMGAIDFIEKPMNREKLLESIARALNQGDATRDRDIYAQSASERIETLTARELEVLRHLVAGKQSKIIAYELGISPRTVEAHRAKLLQKMQAGSILDLVRQAVAASINPIETRISIQ